MREDLYADQLEEGRNGLHTFSSQDQSVYILIHPGNVRCHIGYLLEITHRDPKWHYEDNC